MSDPLVLPLAAVVSGILLGRALSFSNFEAAWPVAVFLLLALVAKRRLRRWCLLLALVFVGALADAWHRPGARPTIDAGSRETVVLAGCVVEPSVLSPGRQQFTLELDRDARARVSLPLDDDVVPQRLEYGERIEIEARVRAPRNFNNPGCSITLGIWRGRGFIGRLGWLAHRWLGCCPGGVGRVRWRGFLRCGGRRWIVLSGCMRTDTRPA